MNRAFSIVAIMMMFVLASVCVLALAPTEAEAASVQLAWDYDDSSSITGWTMYYQNTKNPFTVFKKTLADPDARDMWVEGLEGATEYKFWLEAYNDGGKSDPSNSVVGTTEAYAPPDDSAPIIIHIPAPATIIIKKMMP